MAVAADSVPRSKTSSTQFADIARHHIISTAGVDREGRQVVVFFAHRLPAKEEIDHERLLEYMFHTLDNIVESDYTLVYFHHGLRSSNKPGMKWAIRVYRELDRSYKKNVKKMIIMHPTSFVRILLTAFKPVVSVKFGRKLAMMSRLSELETVLYLDQLEVPDAIKQYDRTLEKSQVTAGRSDAAHFYNRMTSGAGGSTGGKVFGVPPCVLAEQNGGDPVLPMLVDCARHVRSNADRTVGIFRRSANSNELKDTKMAYEAGKTVDVDSMDVHTAACLLKLFVRELPEPLLTYALYEPVIDPNIDFMESHRVTFIADLLSRLPDSNLRLLLFILDLLVAISEFEATNLMSKPNLATVFGPNLLWSNKAAASLDTMKSINHFLLAMLENYTRLKDLL
ncbi:rho GTPase-activating protein 1-like [Sycon ciliatum]|uniref:rho GTPase-activating protein 1-like n=1 Tax=Sycon ciliatum TaxID=27933 RepID=UPI0020A928DC|eukprot:scpid53936/ scgid6221/ Rho GTPase-activating protein 1; Rho-type GTPase-activating protein 1